MSKKFLTPVELPADPTNPLEAVTKQYVDVRAGSEVEIGAADPIGASPGAELWYDTDDPSGGVVTPAFDGTPAPVGASGLPGTMNNWARGDHVHAASVYTSFNGTPSAVALVAAPGSSTSWARGDHVHSIQPGLLGRRLSDNGQMAVKQRTVTVIAGGGFLADRWYVVNSGIGVANLNYNTLTSFGVSLPAGRPRPANMQSLIMATAEAAGSLAAADQMFWQQGIEGLNLQHLNWGTTGAQPLTYSFDIYSNIATTYVVELYRAETTARSISALLSVPAGFSTQSVTFPGDQTTAITNDSLGRLYTVVWIGAGSQFTSGTLQTSWGNNVSANRCPGISNAFGATINNVFAITNAQLEVGTVATPYEVRPYGAELQTCLRYYRQTAPATYGEGAIFGYQQAGNAIMQSLPFPVPMRAAPTAAIGGTWTLANGSSQQFSTSPNHYNFWFNATALGVASMYSNNNGFLTFTAEI